MKIKRGLRLSKGDIRIKVVHYQKPVITHIDDLKFEFNWYLGERHSEDLKDHNRERHPLAGKKKMTKRLAYPGQVVFKFLSYPDDIDWVGEMGVCSDFDFKNHWGIDG